MPTYEKPFDLVGRMASCSDWLPLSDELVAWFTHELPRVGQGIPIHILYEDLHMSSPWPRVRAPLPQGGPRHAQ